MKTRILLISGVVLFLAALPLRADVREGLVAYWPMDTASGANPMTTPDVVAGNDLIGPNKDSSTALVSGKFGNAVTFAGDTSDYLCFTNPPGSDTGLPVANYGSWTWALWVKGPSGQANQTTYFCETSSTNTSGNPRFSMEGNGGDKTRYYIRDINNVVRNSYVGTKPSLDNTWHHVAYTYDGNTGRFLVYVDGQPDCTNTFSYPRNLASWNQVGVGALVRNTVMVPFNGQIDDVALWARVLSQAEIQQVMTNSIATPVPKFAPKITVQPEGANMYEGDSYSTTAFVSGSRPLYYQWLKNGTNYPAASGRTLSFSSASTNDTGLYQLVVTNIAGSVTSVVVQIVVNSFGSPDLTNGLVAYWPLDSVVGVKTPDLVSGYDLTLAGTTLPTTVPGKWGNAMSFNAAQSQYARRIHNPGDALPAFPRTNFTVSAWVKAPWSAGSWFFTESSTLNNNPAFCLGQRTSYNDKLNTFVRTDAGVQVNDNRASTTVVWDDNWHHVVWVQRAIGSSTFKVELYIDGVLDGLVPTVAYPVSVNNTALGAFARATPSQFFTGLVDEVAIWERPLSAAEVALLTNSYITNPPVRLTPLAVNSFKSDLPAVAQGDSTVLRWDVPANADSIWISGIGDVTGITVSGVGSTNVTPSATTAYVLTVTRTTGALGQEVARATNVVGVVSGVATNWSLLDNFDFYKPGYLGANGWWIDVGGGSSVVVVTNSSNRMIKTVASSSGAYLPLKGLTVGSNQSCTLFFRMIPTGNPVNVLRQYVGITDRLGNFAYQYMGGNIGPAVQPTVNDPTQNPGDWLLAARDIPYSPLTFATNVLQTGAVYSVWIDVTNVFIGDGSYPGHEDMFTVYIQKEGDAVRTCIFTNFTSDRDNGLYDPLTGGYATDNLNRIYVCGNSATDSALFDDFYLSKSGYNSTTPRSFGYAGPAPTLQLNREGTQWRIIFEGKLVEATSILGPWTEVVGATSPYTLPMTGSQKFYRAVFD